MQGNFRSLLKKFCLESTVLGLKYFYLYPDVISRCFWLCNMLAVLSLACLLSWLLYSRFAEMPTRVTIENQYEPVQNLPFPTVTLCSPNQITASFMTHFNRTLVDGNLTLDLVNILPKLLGFYELVPGVEDSTMAQLQSVLELNRYTVSNSDHRYTVPEVMAAVPQSCNDFLKKCFYNNVEENCSSLFHPILTAHGLCCTFNNIYYYHNKRNTFNPNLVLRNGTRAGVRGGLVVITDYNPDDAMDRTILDAGATKTMITDYSEFPSDDEASLTETNVESYHAINPTYTYCSEDVQALPSWSRNCYMEDEHELPFFKHYHNSDCDISCYAAAVRDRCHCSLMYLPRTRPGDVCNLTSITCIMDVKVQMSEWLSADRCDCPRDCESRRYKVDMLIGNLDAMQHMVLNPYKNIQFNYSTTLMKFYFASSVYTKLKQETVMSIITFASNLGGVFGLCLGCSGISVLEIIFYMYCGIRNHMKRKLRLRRIHTEEIRYLK